MVEDGTGLAQKKVWDQPVETRKQWVGAIEPLALTRQCELAGVNRSTVYAPKMAAKPDEQELTLLGLIDAEYTQHPFYGSRKIRQYLRGAQIRTKSCTKSMPNTSIKQGCLASPKLAY